jgi:thiamine biosynthesis protein ThiI
METRVILLRYGEIALKSKPVRKQLVQRLKDNIKIHFLVNDLECHISSDYGRIYIYCDDHEKAMQTLKRVFGLVSFSSCIETTSELEVLEEETASFAGTLLNEGMKFAIRTKRVGTHPFSSQSLAEKLGSVVLESVKDLKVDLDHPDVEVFVEVRHDRAFIFNDSVKGPGGLPLGSQGRVLSYVENENDMIATWLMMKRGCKVDVAHPSEEGPHEKLILWDPKISFHKCSILDDIFRISENINSDGIVLGWDMEKVLNIDLKKNVPIFYPLSGFGAREIDVLRATIHDLEKHPYEQTRNVAQNA